MNYTYLSFLFAFLLPILLPLAANAQQRLSPDLYGRVEDNYFGKSVAISADGQTMVVGEPGGLDGPDTSRVYIYRRVDNDWQLNFTVFDGSHRSLGSSVAVTADGTSVVMGASALGSDETPYVGVFTFTAGSGWQQSGQTIFAASSRDDIGCSVDINDAGNVIAISKCFNGGWVQAYRLNGGEWQARGSRLMEGGAHLRSVALSADGTRMVIGSPYVNDFAGEVRVFEFSNNDFQQVGPTLPGLASSDNFGTDVDISDDGKRIVIGVPGDGRENGTTVVMEEKNGEWPLLGRPFSGNVAEGMLGNAVSIAGNGDVVAFSAPRLDDFKGMVFVVEWNGESWEQVAALAGASRESFGQSVALTDDGSRIMVGTQFNDVTANNAGRVAAFDLNVTTSVTSYAPSGRSVYPNPTSGPVTIDGDPRAIEDLRVYDLTGHLLRSSPRTNGRLNLIELPVGVYLLTWREDDRFYRTRVTRQ